MRPHTSASIPTPTATAAPVQATAAATGAYPYTHPGYHYDTQGLLINSHSRNQSAVHGGQLAYSHSPGYGSVLTYVPSYSNSNVHQGSYAEYEQLPLASYPFQLPHPGYSSLRQFQESGNQQELVVGAGTQKSEGGNSGKETGDEGQADFEGGSEEHAEDDREENTEEGEGESNDDGEHDDGVEEGDEIENSEAERKGEEEKQLTSEHNTEAQNSIPEPAPQGAGGSAYSASNSPASSPASNLAAGSPGGNGSRSGTGPGSVPVTVIPTLIPYPAGTGLGLVPSPLHYGVHGGWGHHPGMAAAEYQHHLYSQYQYQYHLQQQYQQHYQYQQQMQRPQHHSAAAAAANHASLYSAQSPPQNPGVKLAWSQRRGPADRTGAVAIPGRDRAWEEDRERDRLGRRLAGQWQGYGQGLKQGDVRVGLGYGEDARDRGSMMTGGHNQASPEDISLEQSRGPRFQRPRGEPPAACDPPAGLDMASLNSADFDVAPRWARFFVVKSYSEDDVHKSLKYGVWSSTPSGNRRLDQARRMGLGRPNDADPVDMSAEGQQCRVFLFFSVNASGQFVGVAEMTGPLNPTASCAHWQQDKWTGLFPVHWHIVKDVPNGQLRHILLSNNDNKPVTNSRDTQEVRYSQGLEILRIFKHYSAKSSLVDDFAFYDQRQAAMEERRAQIRMQRMAQLHQQKQLLNRAAAEESAAKVEDSAPASSVSSSADSAVGALDSAGSLEERVVEEMKALSVSK